MGSSHTGEGETVATDDNVVRLPRDWLGPREHLVPFGSAEPSDVATAEPIGADAFWTESSADVQDAWRGPTSDTLPAQAETSADETGITASEGPAVVRPRTRFRGGARLPHRRVAAAVVAVAGAAAVSIAVVAMTTGGSQPAGLRSLARVHTGVRSTDVRVSGTPFSVPRVPSLRPPADASSGLRVAFQRGVNGELVDARAQRLREARARAARVSAARGPVAGSGSTPVSPPSSGQTSPTYGSSTDTGGGTTYAPSASTGASSNTGSSGSTGSSSGPIGPGATFGPGDLQ